MAKIDPPFYPIICVRGYAGNDDEIADTVADPYMGFNLGSTQFRQQWQGSIHRHYFESPLYRLTKDFGYTDVYSHGEFMPADLEIPPRCVVIYRYYDHQFLGALENERENIDAITGQQGRVAQ